MFLTCVRIQLYINCNWCALEFTPPPTYLSHLISYVYVFTMLVYMFQMLILLFFSYEMHKVK